MARSDSDALPELAHAIPAEPKQYKRFVKDLQARAEHLDEVGRKLLARHGKALPDALRAQLRAELSTLQTARKAERKALWAQDLLHAVNVFDASLDEHLGRHRKSVVREYVDAIFWAVLLTLVIRAFVFEAFKIPTGSMIPTLQIHDHLFVNKFLYGLKIPFTRIKFLAIREPQPGEIIVFEYPYDDDPDSAGKDLIKRVVGVPGDKMHVTDNVIWRNGKATPHKVLSESADCGQEGQAGHRCVQWQECLGGVTYTSQHHLPPEPGRLALDSAPDWPQPFPRPDSPHAALYSPPDNKNFPEFVVPPGHVLVMGDNRDNSKDGRFFGLVPMDTIKGKAGFIWWAYGDDWFVPDLGRMFHFAHQTTVEGTCAQF